jgi:hypothetical protein
MRYLRALAATLVWMKAYFGLCYHQCSTWDQPDGNSRESMNEWQERMRQGMMRYQYERVEQLKEKAIRLWEGRREPC